jgi:hypothetical protein
MHLGEIHYLYLRSSRPHSGGGVKIAKTTAILIVFNVVRFLANSCTGKVTKVFA